MVLIAVGLSATRILGLAANAIALAACVVNARSERPRSKWRRIYLALSLAQLVLLLDIAFDWRWKLHDLFMHAAMGQDLYGERRMPQQLALVLVAAVAATVAAWILWKLRLRRGAGLAAAATVLSVALHGVEMISYHGMDAILYRMAGGVMVVSFLWAALALLTCVGVGLDRAR
jgi:hypothetical protein